MSGTSDNADLIVNKQAVGEQGGDFLIVGMGASAGGIKAFKQFFERVPADSGMAYVVILHLSPDHDSKLAEILQASAAIPVAQVLEATKIEPNHVYVIPPNKSLSMNDGHLALSEIKGYEERRAPVDIFFRTLATEHTTRAVSVILSGTGANGSMGVKRVKEMGGIILVQDPREAEYSDMPRNSIATGLVDYVLPVAEIPAKLIAYKENLKEVQLPLEEPARAETDEQALRDIFTQLRVRTRHDFSNYKRATILRRIERRINVHELSSLPAYARFMRDYKEEAQALLKDLLISVTNFFRDPEAFQWLEQNIIPQLFAGKGAGDYVRVWVAGCATGEEAYSITMMLLDYTAKLGDAPTVQVFATDIDEHAVSVARDGFYTDTDVADVSPERLRRYFTKETDGYRIRREVRETVLFAHHNLIKDPPFSHLDLATCRNLLIYLNRTAQERVMQVMHFALNSGGFLFLGTSESVDGAGDLFALANKEAHVYQSRGVSPRVMLPVPELSLNVPPDQQPRAEQRAWEPRARDERLTYSDLHHRLIEQYGSPSVVVNEKYDIIHLSERADRYLQFTKGDATLNLLKVVRPELRMDLRTALYQAAQKRTNVEARGIAARFDERTQTVNLMVRPALRADDTARGFFLVQFDEAAAAENAESDATADSVIPVDPAALHLEEELTRVKAQLRANVEQFETQAEEMKASNEELQAMNEELRSAAEELETSKEELQSLNEELQTINQELKIKIEELSNTNNDFRNLISSTDIGTIFLDRSLHIKLFTPRARDIFNLISADIGRPLSNISSNLVEAELLVEMEKVLDSLQTVEREVTALDGRSYLMRLLPYRTADDRIEGVVMTFVDITVRKRAEEVVRASEARQAYLLKLGDALRPLTDPIELQAVAARMLGEQINVDRAYYVEINETSREFIVARDWHQPGVSSHARRYPLKDWSMPWLNDGRIWVMKDADSDTILPDAQRAAYRSNDIRAAIVVPLIKAGHLVATLAVNQTAPREWKLEEVGLVRETAERTWAAVERARAEEALAASEEKYRTLFDSIDEGFSLLEIIYDRQGAAIDVRYHDTNRAFERQTGITGAEGKTAHELIPNLEPFWIETYDRVARTGEPTRFENYVQGTDHWFNVYASRIGGEGSKTVAVVFNDITERKRREANLAFLAEVSQDLVRLTNTDEAMAALSRKIGAHFKVSRVNFAAINEAAATAIITHEWHAAGLADIADDRVHRLGDFISDEFFQAARAGELLVVCDTRTDARTNNAAYAPQAVCSFIATPFVRSGQWLALMSIADSEPRDWRTNEIELMRELTSRIWARLERARAEEALRESEERLRLLIESAKDYAILTLDAERRVSSWSAGAEAIFGFTEKEIIGASGDILFTPEDRARGVPQQETAQARASGRAADERWHIRKDGTRFYASGVLAALTEGGRQGFVKIARDLTHQKRAEEEWQRAHDALEERVRARTAELFDLNQTLLAEVKERTTAEGHARHLMRQLVTAQEDERRKIAHDLHDQLGQQLTGLRLKLQSHKESCADDEKSCAEIEQIQAIAERLDADVDFLAWELRPASLEEFGLTFALANFVQEWSKHFHTPAEFHTTGMEQQRLAPEVEINLYRIAQEALNNIAKHAEADGVDVLLERRDSHVELIIEDDGKGFEPDKAAQPDAKKIGLLNMRERAAFVGGTLEIESTPDEGTTVFARVPVRAENLPRASGDRLGGNSA